MARYLVVAHQTATSSELLDVINGIVRREPFSEFALVVPATPVDHLLIWEEGESRMVARGQMEAARRRMLELGARVVRATVGDPSPLAAIGDELLERPDYDA